MEATVCM